MRIALAILLITATAAFPCGSGNRNSNLNSCTTTASCDGSTTNVAVQPAKVVIVSKVGKILCRKCNTKGQRCHGCTLNFVAEEAK